MKRFLIHISVILVLLIALSYVLDKSYNFIFINTSARDKTQLALKQDQGYVDFVFLGSSRVENYIDCNLIEVITGKTCVNYAISGGSHQDAFVLFKLLKKRGLTYSHLFLQLDPNIKNMEMTTAFKASMIPLMEHYEIQFDNVDLSLTWEERHLPFYKYAEYDYLYGIRACFAQLYKNKNDDVELGYLPKYYIGNANAGAIQTINTYNKYIELLKEEVVDDNAQVHFFTSPYCPDMTNTSIFNQLSSFYPGYINYASTYNNPAYFANCNHMNHNGAQVFTKQIIKDFNL